MKLEAMETDWAKPKRMLTAYNFFFQDERSKILAGEADEISVDGDGTQPDVLDEKNGIDNGSSSKSDDAATAKMSGKVSFSNLGKTVGRRWRRLAPEDRVQYEKAAAADKERYEKEMASYKEQCKTMQALKRKEIQSEKRKKRKLEKSQQKKAKEDEDPGKTTAQGGKGYPNAEVTQVVFAPAACTNNGHGNPSLNDRESESGWHHSGHSLPHYYPPRDEGFIRSFWYESNIAAGAERHSMGMPYYYDAPYNHSVPHNRYEREETAYYSEVPNTGSHYISPNSDAERQNGVSSTPSLPQLHGHHPSPLEPAMYHYREK